jgi:hypothetical protein
VPSKRLRERTEHRNDAASERGFYEADSLGEERARDTISRRCHRITVAFSIPRLAAEDSRYNFPLNLTASLVIKVYLLDQALSDRERVENRGFPIRIANSLSDQAEPHAKDCRLRITPRPSRFNHWRACNGIRANSNNPKSLKYPYGFTHKT